MKYRSLNRGNAMELIKIADKKNLIKSERDENYESTLSAYPFTVKFRPKGFSL